MRWNALLTLFFALLFFLFYSQGDIFIVCERFVWLFVNCFLLYFILKSVGMTPMTTFLGLIWYMATPWLVEQSFSLTPVHTMTTIVLLSTAVSIRLKRWYIPWIISLVYIFWQQSQSGFPSLPMMVTNVQRFFSFELLFFKNTIMGRLNAIGVFYPESLALFLIGVFQVLQQKKIIWLHTFLIPWFLNAALVKSGEGFFIFLPFFCLFFAIGMETAYQIVVKRNKENKYILIKTVFVVYGLVLVYGIANFYHYFTNHYLIFDRGL